MIIDIDKLHAGEILETDVCVIGAGAAGITLARSLDAAKVDVCLLEAGGMVPDAASTDRYRGTAVSNVTLSSDYLSVSRLRYFGGTTNHWAGWSRPLDAIDFESRSWIPHSGWPFPRREVEDWYRRAAAWLEVDPPDENAALEIERLPGPSGSFRPATFQLSPPVRFAPAHADALVASKRVRMLLQANVTGLRSDSHGAKVSAATVLVRGEKPVSVRARRYVLATGGIENARLLLVSRDASPTGLGNRHDRVGRFFMDHPHRTSGIVAVTAPEAWLAPFRFHTPPGARCESIRCFKLDESVQRRDGLPNVDLLLGEGRAVPDDRGVAGGIARFDADARAEATRPALADLRVRLEPIPNPDSRVTLSDQRDDLGVPRVHLDWRLTDRDSDAIRSVTETFAVELGRASRGRVRLTRIAADPTYGIHWGSHHIGTTRMHGDPKQGVVDRNARVHGVENLFVAGSSVFPTAGASNPTFTIVALALRLAEHLTGEVLR